MQIMAGTQKWQALQRKTKRKKILTDTNNGWYPKWQFLQVNKIVAMMKTAREKI